MSTLLGYINLLLVLIQPAPAAQEPVFQEKLILPVTVEWIQPVLPNAFLHPVAIQPTLPEAVTHSNKALLSSGSIIIAPINALRFKVSNQLQNKRRNSVKLFILYCQLKSDLFLLT